jgi:hypothetical protein
MLEGIKTSEFILLCATIALGYGLGQSAPIVAASSIIAAGLYALSRGIAKKGG